MVLLYLASGLFGLRSAAVALGVLWSWVNSGRGYGIHLASQVDSSDKEGGKGEMSEESRALLEL